MTALHAACKAGHLEVCRTLLEGEKRVADVHDGDGDTPLYIVLVEGPKGTEQRMLRLQIIHLLLAHGASKTAPYSVKGKLPHELAAMQKGDPDAKLIAAALHPASDAAALAALLPDNLRPIAHCAFS